MDNYKGILWDIEESPYFKGERMDEKTLDESTEFVPMSLDEVYKIKFELEEELADLFRDFEARTGMTIRCAYPIVDEDTIEDVELEVVL